MKNKRSLFIMPVLALSAAVGAEVSVPAAPSDAVIARQRAAAAHFIGPYFNELDCEDLGYVQSGEVDEHMSGVFFSLDRDQSRSVTLAEWQSYPYLKNKELNAIAFDIADADDNGRVSYRELTEYLVQAIQSLDSDNDDEVHPEDLQRYFADTRVRR